MILEKVDYPFLHEQMLEEYIKTLNELDSPHFAAIQCDQGGSHNYKVYNACKYARGLIRKELDELKEQKKKLYEELDEKYGVRNKDYFVTMAGTVERRNE